MVNELLFTVELSNEFNLLQRTKVTFSTRIQWYTQRGNGGFGSHIPLEYDPPDLYKNAIKCFKEGLLLHLRDCEGVAQNLFQHYAPGTPFPHH